MPSLLPLCWLCFWTGRPSFWFEVVLTGTPASVQSVEIMLVIIGLYVMSQMHIFYHKLDKYLFMIYPVLYITTPPKLVLIICWLVSPTRRKLTSHSLESIHRIPASNTLFPSILFHAPPPPPICPTLLQSKPDLKFCLNFAHRSASF